jgi:hypothetical protein
MNRENLQRMADYVRTIPAEMFSMNFYRLGEKVSHECGSVGCAIGHCTVLDPRPLPKLSHDSERIDFDIWSEMFTGIKLMSPEWGWCFSKYWYFSDNTPDGAADRIEWLLNRGLPDDWSQQMLGNNPLCYK